MGEQEAWATCWHSLVFPSIPILQRNDGASSCSSALDRIAGVVYNGGNTQKKGIAPLPTVSLNTAALIALAAAVVALAVILGVTVHRLNKLLARNKFDTNQDGEEDGAAGLLQSDLRGRIGALSAQVAALVRAQEQGLNRVGIVRFNPYEDTGGDLSFALAISNNEGNGIVISSLHGRSNSRFYAKPLLNWTSAYALSTEEADAVSRAREAA